MHPSDPQKDTNRIILNLPSPSDNGLVFGIHGDPSGTIRLEPRVLPSGTVVLSSQTIGTSQPMSLMVPSLAAPKQPSPIKASIVEVEESTDDEISLKKGKSKSNTKQKKPKVDTGLDPFPKLEDIPEEEAPQTDVMEADPPAPFGDKLTAEEADGSKNEPADYDIAFFQVSLQNSMNQVARTPQPMKPVNGEEGHPPPTGTIKSIRFGNYEIDTWYAAPYPEEYNVPVLFLCEWCFKYHKSEFTLQRHVAKCPLRCPPGDEIYRDGNISIFEVDGRKNKIYCQNLCLLAKMFLGSKTLYYDVEPFLFYVMTEVDDKGCHFVGYFSKEKRLSSNYNLSCIVTLPINQRKGYGNLLIDFSYALSRRETKLGSPEKPLSDLGLLSYRSYWRNVVAEELWKQRDKQEVSIADISVATMMTFDDVVATLDIMGFLRKAGKDRYELVVNMAALEQHVEKIKAKNYPRIDMEKLKWTPFLATIRGPGRFGMMATPTNTTTTTESPTNLQPTQASTTSQ